MATMIRRSVRPGAGGRGGQVGREVAGAMGSAGGLMGAQRQGFTVREPQDFGVGHQAASCLAGESEPRFSVAARGFPKIKSCAVTLPPVAFTIALIAS